MDNDDILKFAEYLGLKGIDKDLFYESYYNVPNEEYELDEVFDYYYEAN